MEDQGQRKVRISNEIVSIPTVSIMQSKRQISDIQMAIDSYGEGQANTLLGVRNRQINSGVIIDWKQFQDNSLVKSQLLMKDGENEEKTIFSYVVEEWGRNEPIQVIYRWIRKPTKNQNTSPSSSLAHLVEEEHIYRGPMKHYRKNGNGMYIIVQKYSDNSEKIKSIKGLWVQDILKTGVMTDEKGKEEMLSSNVLKLSMRSNKKVTAFLDKNQAIQDIKKKSMALIPSGRHLPFPSNNSIMDKHRS